MEKYNSQTNRIIPADFKSYYVTGAGRISYAKRKEILEGDAQKRRELMGNAFNSYEAAALAKVKLEATNRLKPYAEKELCAIKGVPTIITKYHIPKEKYDELMCDLNLLATNQR